MIPEKILIETPAFVELEGNEVLKFLSKNSDSAQYSVIGFGDQIKLIDYRIKGLKAIEKVINSNQVESFPEDFCFPAQVQISENETNLIIELFDIRDNTELELMLWIATDLEEPIPDYKYPFFRIKSLPNSLYTFVSVFNYHRFREYFEGLVDQGSLQQQVET